MDNKKSTAKQAGVTPAKLGLIGVLAVVLLGVLYLQYGPALQPAATGLSASSTTSRTPLRPTGSAAANAAGRSANNAAPTGPRKKTGVVASWHSPSLDNVVAYDPFALPAAFPQPQDPNDEASLAQNATATVDESTRLAELAAERAKWEGELQGLRQKAVQVIITREKEYVAIVGDQVVHVGDELNGFRVIAIGANGVRLEKDLTP